MKINFDYLTAFVAFFIGFAVCALIYHPWSAREIPQRHYALAAEGLEAHWLDTSFIDHQDSLACNLDGHLVGGIREQLGKDWGVNICTPFSCDNRDFDSEFSAMAAAEQDAIGWELCK